jgi:hypothetical protein
MPTNYVQHTVVIICIIYAGFLLHMGSWLVLVWRLWQMRNSVEAGVSQMTVPPNILPFRSVLVAGPSVVADEEVCAGWHLGRRAGC